LLTRLRLTINVFFLAKNVKTFKSYENVDPMKLVPAVTKKNMEANNNWSIDIS